MVAVLLDPCGERPRIDQTEQNFVGAEAAIADERAAVENATATRDELQRNLEAEQAQIADLGSQLSPYQDTIDAIADADTDAAVHSLELDRAQKNWSTEYQNRLVTARDDHRSVEACRSWGTSGLGVLAGSAAVLAISLLVAGAVRPRTVQLP